MKMKYFNVGSLFKLSNEMSAFMRENNLEFSKIEAVNKLENGVLEAIVSFNENSKDKKIAELEAINQALVLKIAELQAPEIHTEQFDELKPTYFG